MRKITRDRGYPGEDNFTDQSQSIDLIKSTSEEVTIILHRRDSEGNSFKYRGQVVFEIVSIRFKKPGWADKNNT